MKELSLNILDIAQNSIKAGAAHIDITITEDAETMQILVADDGCGMTEEQLGQLSDPFFTTRKTRKVGLGIPFLKMLAEMTGGYVDIKSVHEKVSAEHGTVTKARFGKDHIDFIPLGDIVETVKTLIQGTPEINFTFSHRTEKGEVRLSCAEMREVLGEIPLNEPEILMWIGENLREQYEGLSQV